MKVRTIRDYAQAFSGYAFSANDLVDVGRPVLKIGNIQNYHIEKETESFYNGEITEKIRKYQLQKDDFLIAMTGAGSVGRAGKMIDFEEGYLVNQRVAIIRPYIEKTDSRYLFYYFSMNYVEKYLYNLGIGAGQPNISANDILKTKVLFPELDKQRKIGEILSAYDELIENNNKRIKILEQMAENLYKEWFVRFRFPGYETTEFENDLPKGWEVKRLGEFGVNLDSGSRPKGGIDDTLTEGIPSLGAEAIGDLAQFDYSSVKYIPHEFYDKMKRGKFDGNAILVYKDGAYIGKTTIFRNKFPFENFAANEHVFLMKVSNFVYQNYLYFTLHQKEYFWMMQNLNRNAAQPGLAQPDIKRIKITVPDETIVKKFNELIEPIFEEVFQLAKANRNLVQQRDMLLPRLMSGKLEVKEAQEKVVAFKPKKTFVEFKSTFVAAARKDGGLTEQDMEELYKAYCDDSRDE